MPDDLFHSHALACLLVFLLCQAFHIPAVAFSIIARAKIHTPQATTTCPQPLPIVSFAERKEAHEQQRVTYAFIVACCKSPQMNSRKALASWSLVATASTQYGKKFAC
jgi:hypothetical protein